MLSCKSILKINRELSVSQPPVANRHSPLLRNLGNAHINDLANSVIEVHSTIDFLQVSAYCLTILVRYELAAVSNLVNYAELIFRLRENRIYRITKPRKVIMAGNENILHASILEVCTYACIETCGLIFGYRNGNPWLGRAAQSLAEVLRLASSKKLDVEFTELVTGYRLRPGAEASYVDIYLYDSLSSGAGYSVSVADEIAELLSDMKELLSSRFPPFSLFL